MSIALTEPSRTTDTDRDEPRTVDANHNDPAKRLREDMAATRVGFTWMGVRKALRGDQAGKAAEAFGAEAKVLSARKRLLDNTHPAFRAVTAVKGRIVEYWKAVSLPFPEPGTRLIRRADLESFDNEMRASRQQLRERVRELDTVYRELIDDARQRLGELFDPDDYPPNLVDGFDVSWDYPSFEPPAYLMTLSPAVYEAERKRVAAQFDQAVTLAQQAFASELAELVEHLAERLEPDGSGQRKVFRDSAVTKLRDFFDRFRTLWGGVGGDAALEALVQRAESILGEREPGELRTGSRDLRQRVQAGMAQVRESLDGMLTDQPRRRVLRTPQPGEDGGER